MGRVEKATTATTISISSFPTHLINVNTDEHSWYRPEVTDFPLVGQNNVMRHSCSTSQKEEKQKIVSVAECPFLRYVTTNHNRFILLYFVCTCNGRLRRRRKLIPVTKMRSKYSMEHFPFLIFRSEVPFLYTTFPLLPPPQIIIQVIRVNSNTSPLLA